MTGFPEILCIVAILGALAGFAWVRREMRRDAERSAQRIVEAVMVALEQVLRGKDDDDA